MNRTSERIQITRRELLPSDIQNVLIVLRAHTLTPAFVQALIGRVLAGEATRNLLDNIEHAERVDVGTETQMHRRHIAKHSLAAIERVTYADVWWHHVGPDSYKSIFRQARVQLVMACDCAGIETTIKLEQQETPAP